MSQHIKYILIGLGFATVVEVINMGILQGNWGGMVMTLLVAYTLFISIGYRLQKKYGTTTTRLVIVYVIMGALGLIGIEWFLIGTYPNLNQTWVSLFIFQVGIFNYWATVGFGPRLFLDTTTAVKPIQKNFLRFYAVSFAVIYIVGLVLLSGHVRFVFMQTISALGSIITIRYFYQYFKVSSISLV